jgi:hypothetical protein
LSEVKVFILIIVIAAIGVIGLQLVNDPTVHTNIQTTHGTKSDKLSQKTQANIVWTNLTTKNEGNQEILLRLDEKHGDKDSSVFNYDRKID